MTPRIKNVRRRQPRAHGLSRDEMTRKERSRIDRIRRVARDYWIHDKKEDKIAAALKVHPSTVTRILQEAKELGVVETRIDEGMAAQGERDESSGLNLRNACGLDECIAVEVLVLDAYDRSEDEFLHRALSKHSGQRLQGVLDAGMHLCVGGGRAVYQTARVFARKPALKKRVRITPLCGRIWAHSWEPKGSGLLQFVDADDVAIVIAGALTEEPTTALSQVSYPLFAQDHTEATRIMTEHCRFLPSGSWRDGKTPARALVGVGGIHPSGAHRFMGLLDGDLAGSELTPHLRSVAEQLKTAGALVTKHGMPHFGDVANRLYPSLPLPEDFKPGQARELAQRFDELRSAIGRINNRMVIVDWNHLRQVEHVLAIAGGPWKVKAIWTLLVAGHLHPDRRILTELCTDAATANALTTAFQHFNDLNPASRSWYEELTQRLFQ